VQQGHILLTPYYSLPTDVVIIRMHKGEEL